MKAYKAVVDFRTRVADRVQDYHWEDIVITEWLNDAIRQIVRQRPDSLTSGLIVTSLPAELTDITSTGNDLPVNDFFKEACVLFLCSKAYGEAKMPDLAQAKMSAFERQLVR